MSLLLVIVILLLLFGAFGVYSGPRYGWGIGIGPVGLILVILVVLLLTGHI